MTELDDIVSTKCATHQLIDNTLRSYLHFATHFKHEFLDSPDNLGLCIQKLLQSELFAENKEYIRTQIVYSLLQEDEPKTQHVIASFLLLDGQQDGITFEMMNNEGCFSRLLELVMQGKKDDAHLHRLLLELLYGMSRCQRVCAEDLLQVDDEFVLYLFNIIEELSDDVDDPYHYPVIRVLVSKSPLGNNHAYKKIQLVLNEQYMISSTSSSEETIVHTNRVIKVLSLHGSSYMTFGENIILLLNRETETSLQLLILKLLYLVFTTPSTYEYFYTNDLRVLLDVIIRNLLDLPNDQLSLRHTYLRVLYPLLAYTQLNSPPHYKKDEITKVLALVSGSGFAASLHWEPADETTLRLVERVAKVPWLRDDEVSDGEVARKLLGISLSPEQTASSVSVLDVAAVMEKPGVQTPSRKEFDTDVNPTHPQHQEEHGQENGNGIENGNEHGNSHSNGEPKLEVAVKKVRPPPPVGRRSRAPPPAPPAHLKGKKLPPKAPPRRRTRLKSHTSMDSESVENHVSEALPAEPVD